jgi:hypothetical protein
VDEVGGVGSDDGGTNHPPAGSVMILTKPAVSPMARALTTVLNRSFPIMVWSPYLARSSTCGSEKPRRWRPCPVPELAQ